MRFFNAEKPIKTGVFSFPIIEEEQKEPGDNVKVLFILYLIPDPPLQTHNRLHVDVQVRRVANNFYMEVKASLSKNGQSVVLINPR